VKIVVIGGGGRTGRSTVGRLVAQGHEVVSASRATGVDTINGEGLAGAITGASGGELTPGDDARIGALDFDTRSVPLRSGGHA
jgi:hypothetical protein